MGLFSITVSEIVFINNACLVWSVLAESVGK